MRIWDETQGKHIEAEVVWHGGIKNDPQGHGKGVLLPERDEASSLRLADDLERLEASFSPDEFARGVARLNATLTRPVTFVRQPKTPPV
jgi:hypothetical protein